MRTERAWAILGFSEDDIPDTNLPDIKQRYHRLISRHHPDLVTDADPARQKFHIEKAQLINEAYATLKDALSSDTPDASASPDHTKRKSGGNSFKTRPGNPQKKSQWKAPINKKAFCQRDIYINGGEYKGHKLDRYKIARGKYFWDPDLEEFDMFLYSLNQVAVKLLDQVEEDEFFCDDFDLENVSFHGKDSDYAKGYGNSSGYRNDTLSQRSQYQILIFHLLSEMFIEPVYCLRKIAPQTNSGNEIYQFTAQMTSDERLSRTTFPHKHPDNLPMHTSQSHLHTEQLLYPAFLKNNRLYVKEKAGSPLGYLSFPDDRLYLFLIPLMREKKVKLKMQVTSVEKTCSPNDSHIQLSLWLYLKPDENQKQNHFKSSEEYYNAINQSLKRRLLEYASYIKDK